MTTQTFNPTPDSDERLNADNVWGLMPVVDGEAGSALEKADPVVFSNGVARLCNMSKTDKAYVGHDVPQPILCDIFASESHDRAEPRIRWEGIAIGLLLAGFAVLGSAVIFKVAAFGSLFAGESAARAQPGVAVMMKSLPADR